MHRMPLLVVEIWFVLVIFARIILVVNFCMHSLFLCFFAWIIQVHLIVLACIVFSLLTTISHALFYWTSNFGMQFFFMWFLSIFSCMISFDHNFACIIWLDLAFIVSHLTTVLHEFFYWTSNFACIIRLPHLGMHVSSCDSTSFFSCMISFDHIFACKFLHECFR